MFVMRLKIAEIETMAVHNQKEGMLFNLQNLQTVSKTMTDAPDKAQLNARGLATPATIFSALRA
jgi:hypothetical protein